MKRFLSLFALSLAFLLNGCALIMKKNFLEDDFRIF